MCGVKRREKKTLKTVIYPFVLFLLEILARAQLEIVGIELSTSSSEYSQEVTVKGKWQLGMN